MIWQTTIPIKGDYIHWHGKVNRDIRIMCKQPIFCVRHIHYVFTAIKKRGIFPLIENVSDKRTAPRRTAWQTTVFSEPATAIAKVLFSEIVKLNVIHPAPHFLLCKNLLALLRSVAQNHAVLSSLLLSSCRSALLQ